MSRRRCREMADWQHGRYRCREQTDLLRALTKASRNANMMPSCVGTNALELVSGRVYGNMYSRDPRLARSGMVSCLDRQTVQVQTAAVGIGQ